MKMIEIVLNNVFAVPTSGTMLLQTLLDCGGLDGHGALPPLLSLPNCSEFSRRTYIRSIRQLNAPELQKNSSSHEVSSRRRKKEIRERIWSHDYVVQVCRVYAQRWKFIQVSHFSATAATTTNIPIAAKCFASLCVSNISLLKTHTLQRMTRIRKSQCFLTKTSSKLHRRNLP